MCSRWKRKSCSTCNRLKNGSCFYLKHLNTVPQNEFYCFEWAQIPYDAILKIPGMRLYDYHVQHPLFLKRFDIGLEDLMSHIPPESEGDIVAVISDIEKSISLIYFRAFRKYAFIHNDGLEFKDVDR
jgi:hypothetical protein